MKHFQQLAATLFVLTATFTVGVAAWWLVTHPPGRNTSDRPPSPAVVGKVVKEDELNTVTLTPEAAKRIGLTVSPIERKAVGRVRLYGGEVMVPAGRSILVAAPLTGLLKAPAEHEGSAGEMVEAGQTVFDLIPLLTPDGRATLAASLADAEGQVNNARTQVNLTRIAVERARRVLKEGAGSQRQVDEAQAAYEQATKTLDATESRFNVLKTVIGDAEMGTTQSIPITAPERGILRTLSARPGQAVPAGAVLFETIDISTVWVRVPLPVGDVETIDRGRPAQVGPLSAMLGPRSASASPVTAPPSANALSATVDLFYALANPGHRLVPGQRLGVTVPLADAAESPTVPWSAVVYDIHGGTWVYEQTGELRFTRRRIVVGYTVGTDAVLESGPATGVLVVTAGVQELFGAETGFVK